MIRKSLLFVSISIGLCSFLSCKREREPNKIIDGLPINSTETVVPAQMAQQFFLLIRDGLNEIVPVFNRLGRVDPPPDFSELTPVGSNVYEFSVTEKHYGSVTFKINFKDTSGNSIDPIANNTSTMTVRSVHITASGTSSLFTYSQDLVLTLETAGLLSSDKRLTGNSTFTGATDAVTFTFVPPGSNSTFQGLTNGMVLGSGSGPSNQNISITLTFSSNHEADGQIAWLGREAAIHFLDNGVGYVATKESRTIIP